MQENEKYGIELEAKTNLFKKGLQEAIKYTKAFGQGVKESFNEQVSKSMKSMSDFFREDFNIFDKDYSKRIDYIKDEMDAVTDQINAIKEGGKEGNLSELEAEYDRLTKKLEFFTTKQGELNEKFEETDNEAKNTKSTLSTLFEGSIGKIKRFTYYLLGARSVFSLFMRYRSAYYQFNEEMQYQSELSQNAIALSLGPAFEFLGNVIAYASIGLAKFIELLTGVNVLSKVTTKGIKDYNKSLKETQTLVSGIDEITNLTNPQTLGLADQYKALDDFRKKIAEVEEFFKKNEWTQGIVDGVKEIWGILEDKVWPVIKDKLWPIIRDKVWPLITEQIWPFMVKYIVPLIEDIVELVGDVFGLVVDIFDKLGVFEYVIKPIMAFLKTVVHLAEFVVDFVSALFRLDVQGMANASKKLIKNVEDDWADVFKKKHIIKADYKVEDKKDFEEAYKKLKEIRDGDYGSIIIDFGGERKFKEFQKWLIDTKKDADLLENSLDYSTVIDDDANKFQYFKKQIDDWEIDKKVIEVSLKYNIPKKQVQDLLDKARWLSVKVMGMNETSFNNLAMQVMKKFGYAKGLDYVPYDNYPALLHKGEAVVPAKYNPTIHSEGNDYTNSLLETLVMKVDDLARRPNVLEIDGQKFANATYGLYDNERKRQGYIEGVVR